MARRHKPNVFEREQPVLYKGFHATYGSFQTHGKLHSITMNKDYVYRHCREIAWQQNVYAERQGVLYLRVKGTSLQPMYQNNEQAKQLLEVEY